MTTKKAPSQKNSPQKALQTAQKKSPRKAPAKPKTAPVFPSTGYWLLKSEPESYSIDKFASDRKTLWTGVRNYQARNFMMTSMKPGDHFLFYHSNAEVTGVVGTGEVVKPNVADPSAQEVGSDYHDPKASPDHPIWFCAEVKFESKLARCVTLAEIRATKALADMALLAPGQRLSIQPVSKSEYMKILEMAKA